MANKLQLITAGKGLRDQLFVLSQDGNFSVNERDGFGRFHAVVAERVVRFTVNPAHGDNSLHYDGPMALTTTAIAAGTNCRPGDRPSQQRYYDAVHAAIDGFKSVTGPSPVPFKKVPVG